MRTQTTLFRLTAAATAWAMLGGTMASAQPAPTQPFSPQGTNPAQGRPIPPALLQPRPTQAAPGQPGPTQPFAPVATPAEDENVSPAEDPPATVGRVARLAGTVSFHAADQTQWEPASLNFPVTNGNAFWTEPNSGAEIEANGVRLTLDQQTELDIDQIDEHRLAATLAQGSVSIVIAVLTPGDTMELRTPRGTVAIGQAGQYQVTAGNADTPTTVSVVAGQVQLTGDGLAVAVATGQVASVTGTGPFEANVASLAAPPPLIASQAPPPPLPTGDNAPPPIIQQMTGGDALLAVGQWERNEEYGQVWYPPVEVDYVPYRNGRWAYVQPWGWTWVDEAPWGFAPFHYGRWARIGPRWGWLPVAPGYVHTYRPVYAPALVAFVGIGAGLAIGAAYGRSVGWLPLGPREVYRPPYRHSSAYIRNVNVINVTNVTNFNTRVVNNTYINRGATTVVPAAAMAGSQRIAPRVQQVPPAALAQIQPMRGPVVRPTSATAGVTPAVARQLQLAPPIPGTAAPRQVAPGPQVRPQRAGTAVPLRPTGADQGQQPGRSPQGAPGQGFRPGQDQRPNQPGVGQPGPGPAAPGPRPTAQPGPQQGFPPGGQQGGQPGPRPGGQNQPGFAHPAPGPSSPGPAAPGPSAPGPSAPGSGLGAPGRPQQGNQPGAQPGSQPFARPGTPAAPSPGPAPRPSFPQPGQGIGPGQGAGPGPGQQPRPSAPQFGQQPAPGQIPRPQFQAPQPAPRPQQAPQAQPQQPRFAPQPSPQVPRPMQQPQAPQPQVQRPQAPPQQHFAPPPQRPQPPPQQHAAPPQQHAAPPPQPRPQAAPAPAHRACPPGRPSC